MQHGNVLHVSMNETEHKDALKFKDSFDFNETIVNENWIWFHLCTNILFFSDSYISLFDQAFYFVNHGIETTMFNDDSKFDYVLKRTLLISFWSLPKHFMAWTVEYQNVNLQYMQSAMRWETWITVK